MPSISEVECGAWNEKSDIWCAACIFAELYTGEILFDAENDTEHMAMIEKVAGTFPTWMVVKAEKELLKCFRYETDGFKFEIDSETSKSLKKTKLLNVTFSLKFRK